MTIPLHLLPELTSVGLDTTVAGSREDVSYKFPIATVRGYINVVDYGAHPTASEAVNTAAIQSALYAAVDVGGPKHVHVPAGVYSVDELLIPASVKITGDGIGRTILKKQSATGRYVIYVTSATLVTIKDLTIDCNSSVLATARGGIEMLQCSACLIENVEVLDVDVAATGMLLYTGGVEDTYNNIKVRGCRVIGNNVDSGNGILLGDMLDSSIVGCYVYGCQGLSGVSPGIGLQLKNACLRCTIENSQAINCATGIGFGSDGLSSRGVSYSSARGVQLLGNTTGILMFDTQYCSVADVTIDHVGAANAGNSVDIRTLSYTQVGNSLIDIRALNVPDTRDAVRIRDGSTFNIVRLSYLLRVSAAANAITFDASAEDNVVIVDRGSPAGTELQSVNNGLRNIVIHGTPPRMLRTVATLNLGAIAGGTSNYSNVTLNGVQVTDSILITPLAALEAGIVVWGFRSGANTVRVYFQNCTADSIDPASRDYLVMAIGPGAIF